MVGSTIITNQLNYSIMSKKSQSLILGATSIFCACVVAMLFPAYVSDVRELCGCLTFTGIDWRLTARNTLAFSAASFFVLALIVDAIILAVLAYNKQYDN